MSAKPNLWQAPRTLGAATGSLSTFVAIACVAVFLTITGEIAAMYGAAQLHYDRALGEPWIHRPHIGPFTIAPELYSPLAPFRWLVRFANPFGPHQSNYVLGVLSSLSYVLGAGAVVSIVAAVVIATLLDRPRADGSELHDSGHWSDTDELREAQILGAKAGPIIGGYEIRRGKVVPLRYAGENGIEYVAPPGDGKSGLLKSNLLIPLQHEDAETWSPSRRRADPWGEEPSMLVLDLKADLLKSTSGYQKRKLGKQVFVFAPYGIRGWRDEDLSQYNTFSTIRLGSDDTFDDCYAKGLDIADPEGKGLPTHWDKTCCAWFAGVIEKLGYLAVNTGNLDYFTLPGLYDFLASFQSLDDCIKFLLETEDDPKGRYEWIDVQNGQQVSTKVSPTVAAAAREMAMKEGPEKTSVQSTALSFLTYLRSRRIRRFVMRSTWDMRSLATDKKAARIVYIVIPPGKLKAIRPLLRMMLNDLIRTNMEDVDVDDGRSVRSSCRSLIAILDEVAALKNLDELETSSGYARGFGVMFWLFWQSVFQKYKHYTENESITETLDVSVFGRPKTTKAAKYVVELMGKIDLSVRKRSVSGKRATLANVKDQESESQEEVPRDLLTPTELRRLDRAHAVGIWGGLTIYLTKFDFWRNPILLKRSRIAPVTRSDRSRDPDAPIVVPKREPIVEKAEAIVAGAVAEQTANPAVPPAQQAGGGDAGAVAEQTANPAVPPAQQAGGCDAGVGAAAQGTSSTIEAEAAHEPTTEASMPAQPDAAAVQPAASPGAIAGASVAEAAVSGATSVADELVASSAAAFAILEAELQSSLGGTAPATTAVDDEPESEAVLADRAPHEALSSSDDDGHDDDDGALAALRGHLERLALPDDVADEHEVTDEGYERSNS